MGLIFLVGLKLRQARTHFVRMGVLRLDVLLVSAPLLDRAVHGRGCFLERLFRLPQRGFNRMKTLGDASALLGDLDDAKIELLQFNERGQVLVQCTPMPAVTEEGLGCRSIGGPTRTRT